MNKRKLLGAFLFVGPFIVALAATTFQVGLLETVLYTTGGVLFVILVYAGAYLLFKP